MTPAQGARSFRWTEQRFVFEVTSADSELLSRAAGVFQSQPADPAMTPDLSWHVGSAESGDAALLRIEADAIDFLLRNSPDSAAVHAALLSRNGRGVVIVGPSLAGKSTLAVGLWRVGWSLMADDLVFLDALDRTAHPAPRRVSLRKESRQLVGDSLWQSIERTPSCIHTAKGLFFHPHEVTSSPRQEVTSLSAIFFLARRGASAGPAELIELNSARAAVALLPYALNLRDLPFMDGLCRITPLADTIPAWDLGRGHLAAMVAAIERQVG